VFLTSVALGDVIDVEVRCNGDVLSDSTSSQDCEDGDLGEHHCVDGVVLCVGQTRGSSMAAREDTFLE